MTFVRNLLWLALTTVPAWAGCPPGSGDFQCRAAVEVVAMPAAGECPAGTHAWVDARGNPICEGLDGDPVVAAASECPKGSTSTVDEWGNRRCKVL